MRIGARAIARRVRAFVADTRAGATAIAAAAVTVMTVGASALIVDHVWLVDQRDILKTAAEAGAIAATLEIGRQLENNPGISDEDLKKALHPVAARYVFTNLMHLPIDRLLRAKDTLEVEITEFDRVQGNVGVTAKADLGGTLFSRNLPLLGSYEGPEHTVARADVKTEITPIEVVLAIDITSSMLKGLSGTLYDGQGGCDNGVQCRINIVKRAAKRLVDILAPNAYNRVAVGVVPWHVNVRLGAGAAREWARNGWARYPAKRTYPVPYLCYKCTMSPAVDALPASPPQAWKGCFDGHRMGTGNTARIPATAEALFVSPASRSPFAQNYFPPANGNTYRCRDATDIPAGASNHCLERKPSRAQHNCPTQAAALFPLSTDRTAVKSAVDAIRAVGGLTNSGLGVLWAQRMLEPSWKGVWGGTGIHPANPETTEHADLRKAIVLLTDGQDTYCGVNKPSCENTPLTTSRTEACTAAKARGTEVFVIAAMHPNQVSGALGSALGACSSESDQQYPDGTRRPGTTYVFLNNATPEALEAAFTDIANQLRSLRRTS